MKHMHKKSLNVKIKKFLSAYYTIDIVDYGPALAQLYTMSWDLLMRIFDNCAVPCFLPFTESTKKLFITFPRTRTDPVAYEK